MQIIKGNLLESDCEILVNAVNSIGIMGGGIAKQFAEKYPEMLKDYQDFCTNKGYKNRHTHFYTLPSGKVICNLLTVDNISGNLEYIEKGLRELRCYMRFNDKASVAIPLLGTGIGRLNKNEVLNLITHIMESKREIVKIYEI